MIEALTMDRQYSPHKKFRFLARNFLTEPGDSGRSDALSSPKGEALFVDRSA